MRYSRCCLLSSRNSSLFKAVELDDWDKREQLRHAMLDAMLLGTRFSSCSVQVPTNTRRSYEMFSGGCATENLLNVGRRRCSSSASLFHSNNHRCASFSRGIFSYLSFLFCFSPVSFFWNIFSAGRFHKENIAETKFRGGSKWLNWQSRLPRDGKFLIDSTNLCTVDLYHFVLVLRTPEFRPLLLVRGI